MLRLRGNALKASRYIFRPPNLIATRLISDKVCDITIDGTTIRERKLQSVKINAQDNTQDNTPWYLKDSYNENEFLPTIEKFEMPEIPKDSPQSLKDSIWYIGHDLGLENVVVLDMMRLGPDDEVAVKNFARYMVICTGKSGKHIMKSTFELHSHLKKHYGVVSQIEGLTHETAKKAHKRMKRSARKSGRSGVDDLYGDAAATANSWIMVDSGVDGIYFHILTQERREELNLEHLWSPEEDKSKYERHIESKILDDDNIFAGIRYYHTSTRAFNRSDAQSQLMKYIMLRGRRQYSQEASSPRVSRKLSEIESSIPQDPEKLLQLFQASAPQGDLYRLEKFIQNKEGSILMRSVTDLILNKNLNNDELFRLFEIFRNLFTTPNQNVILPSILRQILSSKLEPLTIDDLKLLVETFIVASPTYDQKAHADFINEVSKMIRTYAARGGSLELDSTEVRSFHLLLADLVFSDGNSVSTEEGFQSFKTGYYLQLLSSLISDLYPKIKSQKDMESAIQLKNNIMVKALKFYMDSRSIDSFYSIWKHPDFRWSPSNIQNGVGEVSVKLYDSRPWKEFFNICYETEDHTIINQALNYFSLNFGEGNIALSPEVQAEVIKSLNFVDPDGSHHVELTQSPLLK